MSAVDFFVSQRGRVGVVLSLILVWTVAYFFWMGGHERLTTSQNINNPNIDDHFAFHSKIFAAVDPAKSPHGDAANFDNHYAFHTKTFIPTPAATKVQNTDGKPIADIFVSDFNSTAIKEICAKTSWAPSRDIVINCEGREGDIADVKQKILICLRDAIEIGASLMRPTITIQSGGLAEYENGSIHSMSYMFDLDIFYARLRKSCPLLPIYENIRTLERHGRSIAHLDRPMDLLDENGQPMTPKDWAEKHKAGEGKITLINYPQVIGQTSVCKDDDSFAINFGKVMEIRPDAKLLAESALLELQKRFDLSSTTSNGVMENAFVGLHLGTEADATDAGNASYEQQAAAYLKSIASTSLRLVYVASGYAGSLEPFAKAALAQLPPIHVVTKWDLLQGDDVAILKTMTWDQQALVDYLILQKSSRFAGFSAGSFSWSIAYRRQQFGDLKPCTSNGTNHVTDDGVIYEDSLSILYGHKVENSGNVMWP